MLAEIDPAANSESGQWSREGEGLIAAAAPYAKLRLLPDVPEEYDLEVTFTRTSGEDSVALIFATQSQQATFEIDAWQQQLAGIQLINGHNLQQPANPTRVADLRLVNGRQYTVSLQVRRNRIDVWLDGSPLTTFVNDGSTLSPLPDWALTDSSAILTYLADRHGKLTHPAGTIERARQDALTHCVLDELDAVLWTAARHGFVLPEDRRVPAVKDSLKWEFTRNVNRLAERFEGPFAMGETMTIADIVLTHCLNWAYNARFTIESEALLSYAKAMRGRDAFRRVMALNEA